MSKHRHSKDRMFITYSEHKHEWGGKKDAILTPLTRLPFNCCSLSLEPFKNPVCTQEGHVFDIVNIIPFIKKYKKNPINGLPLRIGDLIKLNFYKNDKGEYHDPVSFKVFTDYTKIVAIKTSGNVYVSDTVEELNRKPKHWVDLYTGEEFTYKDIIVLQDPKNILERTVKEFDFLKNHLKFEIGNKDGIYNQSIILYKDKDISNFLNLDDSSKLILVKAKEQELKRKREDTQKAQEKNEENETIRKKIRTEIDSEKSIPVSEWLEFASNSKLFISDRYATSHDSFAVTSTQAVIDNSNGKDRFRNMTKEEIRKILYDEVRASKEKGYVQLILNQGSLNLEIHADLVPQTAENFLELCEKGYYDKSKFHKLQENVLLEGGDPTGTGYGGESIFGQPFKNEINNKLSHNKAGMISMANLGPTHNTSMFFITLSEQKEKDGKFSVFGEVVGGYQILYKINKITTNIWQRPDFSIRILETKVFKNPFRDIAKKILAQKELEISKEYQEQQQMKTDERWIQDDSKFEMPKHLEKKEDKTKGLGLAQSLISSFSTQEIQKQVQQQKFNFEHWK